MSTKEHILAKLATGPKTRDQLLEEFVEAAQIRGAASVLSYLVRSGQVAESADGLFIATGAPPQKPATTKKPRAAKKAPAAPEPELDQVEADDEEERIEIPSQIDMGIWSTGELSLHRDDQKLLLSPAEVRELVDFLGRVGAIEETA